MCSGLSVACSVLPASPQVLDMLMDGSDLVSTLQSNTRYFRTVLKEAGFTLKVNE